MDRRQNLMSRQSADIKKAINYKTLNLDEEIAAAKKRLSYIYVQKSMLYLKTLTKTT